MAIAAGAMLFGVVAMFSGLRPVGSGTAQESFIIEPGEGARVIAARLEAQGLIRSELSFMFFGVLSGAARELKPGAYSLSPSTSALAILKALRKGMEREATVTIPEGTSAREIDAILAAAGVTRKGEVAMLARDRGLEGKLFPDTYRFFVPSEPEEVILRFTSGYDKKAVPILAIEPARAYENLILASLIEKEVPDSRERQIVSGILRKRLAVGMALQVDASICYVKEGPCHPVTDRDLTIDSPYNTYKYKGLPPGPISNPGEDALRAAIAPLVSPYWFYLSDPLTLRTVFARTLDEHRQNRVKYLNQ
ncbi:MAG: endolytic transglycosylase MltG [bacterium]|nr:endolytic transglycosylase MltG [bacterium]